MCGTLNVERSSPMLATAYGNGPFVPTIVWRGEAYTVAQAMDDMGEAIQAAADYAAAIRDSLRSEGYDALLAALD